MLTCIPASKPGKLVYSIPSEDRAGLPVGGGTQDERVLLRSHVSGSGQ